MDFKAFIIDLDGVVYRGSQLIPNADKRIASLQKKARVIFLTNNSTLTRAQYAEKLGKFGIACTEGDIITSSYAAAQYIKKNYTSPRVFIIGEDGMRKELEQQGVNISWSSCNLVVTGLDRNFNYQKLAMAVKFIRGGAGFIATNTDATLITETGLLPGAGAIVSAVQVASGREAIVVGKPSGIMVEIILARAGVPPREILLIGDRLETDVAMGKKAGMKTALVLTGCAKKEDVDRSSIKPDYILETL